MNYLLISSNSYNFSRFNMIAAVLSQEVFLFCSFLAIRLLLFHRFYVGCDGCEGWFHPSCVGITQAEAEASDTYLCPNCESKGSQTSTNIPIKGAMSAALRKLVKALQVKHLTQKLPH